MMSQEEDSDEDTQYMELGTSQIAQGEETRESDTTRHEPQNPRGQDGSTSRTQDEYRHSDRITSAGSTVIVKNVYKFINSPVIAGTCIGNNVFYDISMKLYAITDDEEKDEEGTIALRRMIRAMVEERKPRPTSLACILQECNAHLICVEEGCVKLTLRVYSCEGLGKLWTMFTSGELERRLMKDLPISKVGILEGDYRKGCWFFEDLETTKEKESYEQDGTGQSRNQQEMASLAEDFFGQKLPPLYIYLKRVLDKYPEGGQILKELVQNADDAKARNVVFLYDKSEHPRQRLWSDALKDFQGPALYAYNDASFTKQDWENIQHPEQSSKRKDPTKVGKFGLGFISVFHLTDMPCILSGDQIGYLDPLEEHFNFNPHTNTTYVGQRGKRWKLSGSLLDKFTDQFSPFLNDLFECNEATFQRGRFPGTLFRFPLRTRPSKISASVFHNEQRVLELFESFRTDAELSLLFLKNVESIALYERDQSHRDPKLVFKVQIRQVDRQQIRLNMVAFLSQIQEKNDFHTVSCLHIERQLGPKAVGSTSRYITVNTLKNKNTSSNLKGLIDDEDLKVLPWMGMSFQINCPAAAEQAVLEQNGRVFCFLPLPESVVSGLPVHVHGYFGLSDNRRSIKWPDQESQHDKKARWNQLLVTEVLPEVYTQLILAAIEKSQDPTDLQPRDVYKGWPHKGNVNREWSDFVRRSLQLLKDEAIFYADHGSWMKSTDVYINTRNNDLISKVLMQKECPVAQLPDHVVELLQWADVPYREVTPAVVRDYIRGDPLQFLTRSERLELLEYVTSDSISDLNNVYLLPLKNGTFTCFGKTLPRVFIATREHPSELIPNGEGRFAASDIPAALNDPKVESYTQLKKLCMTDVAPLLLEMLPNTWSKFSATSDVLSWTPGINRHPSVEWLTVMWEWLTQNHMELPLSVYKDIPLIPMPSSYIARLKENGMIFSKHQNSLDPGYLSDDICSFLESVGAVVVHHDLPLHITRHPHLKTFIKAPTPKGIMAVLEVFSHIHNISHVHDCVAHMSSKAKDELRGLLAQPHWEISSDQKDVLRQLPLFVASTGRYVSAERCMAIVPRNFFQIPVTALKNGSRYILQRDITDNLAFSLGVPKRSVSELLAENILPAVASRFYNDNDSLEIMTWVLGKPEFDDLIRELEFIPSTTGAEQIAGPKDLFEPSSTLQVLFRHKNVFPTGKYARGKLLKFLKRVGLKNQSDITSIDVLDSAVESSETQEMGKADTERGLVLLEHINQHPWLLCETVTRNGITKQLHKILEELYWVPCEASPPPGYPVAAGWMGNSATLYSPTDVGLIESALLLGSVLPLIKLPDIREELLSAFIWSKQLNPNNHQEVEQAVRHLKRVANTFQSSQETYAVSHSASLVYKFLSEASDSLVKNIFATHMNESQPWVWHGSGFTTPDKVALSIGMLGVSLVPYLHIVPRDMQRYSDFFARMGVQQTFQETELCTVLLSVHHKHQTELVSSKDDYQTDMNLVCNILRYIVDLDKYNTRTSKILVPCRTTKGRERRINMVEASECLYVDEERLVGQLFDEESEEEFDKPVIHESIPNDLAQRLGLHPLSHFLAPVDEVEYDMAGPYETIVNAIKRNLDMYKNDADIFKELIQNADDAGAKEVKFLLDWRRNEKTAHNLLSEGMKACQGPALWAYNDARFSKDDFKNICSIAAQSKKHQLDKVGRFGLGFTSVYHLTDVPSVVSGPYVLICDPRTIHLGSRVKPGQPGIKLDLTNKRHRRTLKNYPNQFQPYNGIFGCNLQAAAKGFDHTLFRLPLRTEFGADSHQPNQLSDFICDSKDRVDPLIKSLKTSAATLLLFTQNVVHLSLQELSEHDGDIKNVMSITVSRVLQMPRSISSNPHEADFTTERNLLKATAACIGDSGLAVPETTMLVKVTHKGHESNENVQTQLVKKEWFFITSSCMVSGDSLELACTQKGRKAGVLPCGGVAAQLSADEEGCFKPEPIQGSTFSYLPLNVLTGLPFHINGNFLLQPNRRQLWGKSSSGTEEFEAHWNTCFMRTVLCNALLNLLQDLRKLQEQNIVDMRHFQGLWPKRISCERDFYPLVDAFYHTIGRESRAPAVIFSQCNWVTVHECFFTDWNKSDPQSLRASVKALLAKHQDPKRWVELEQDVISSISQARANRCIDDNTFSVKKFLRDVFFPALADCQHFEPEHQKQIVLHVLDLRLGERKVTDHDTELQTTQCIPASPNGDRLVRPEQLVNPSTSTGSLYSEEDGRFPHGSEYRNEARLLSLTQLGMASIDLTWDDICERAESMLKSSHFERRSATLLKLIDEKLRKFEEPTSEQKRIIQRAAFLPILKKPDGYPAKWYECGKEFLSAARLYESANKDLLGSVQPLLDEERLGSEALSHRVKTFLGIRDKEVPVLDVIQQLTVVIDEPPTDLPQTSTVLFKIYSFLQDRVCDVHDRVMFGELHVAVREKHRAAFEKLCSLKFVVCEGEFRECTQLAFSYNGRSGPYLFRVPNMLERFRNLLKVCGVRSNFEVRDYLQTLQLLKNKYEDNPLPEADHKTAKAMISEIVSQSAANHVETQHILKSCNGFVPDKCGILRTPSELLFNDVDWDASWGNNIHTHPDISYNDAKVFGIITQREKQLATCSSFGGFEMEFGQHEELTDRLSSILRSYPNVSDVFKELLQNADDAGATEIHFVYDPRSHQARKIISDSWAPVQKLPSLCVFNDKPFTEADIKGIQKVGVGGKRDDIATSGKFGIGFNAVYHLTDCPSFLSNSDTLCVFDPLLKYIPGTRKTSPGKRFSTGTGEAFRESFPDMLRGYLEDMNDFRGKVGTMFRFPLRTESSSISKETFSSSKMRRLLEEFKKVSQDALLFLNNIKTIIISCINEQTGKLTQEYSISASLSDEDQQHRMKLAEHLKLFNDHPCEDIAPISWVYSLMTKDSAGTEMSWLISQMLGFKDFQIDGEALSKAACLKKPLPKGGVAALIKDSRSEELRDHQQYKAYCFLPLPIFTKLPVHVNGTFELDAARKNLQKGDAYAATTGGSAEYGLIHRWNRLLVENVIAPAYAELISHAGRKILGKTEANKSYKDLLKLYDNIFPKDLEVVFGEWRLLAEATLRYIDRANLQVLPVVKPTCGTISWHHPNSDTSLAFFDNLDLEKGFSALVEAGRPKQPSAFISTLLRPFLLTVDFYLLASSPKLCCAFQGCDVNARFVSPDAVAKYLSSDSVITPGLPAPLKNTAFKDFRTFRAVFEYCLDGITKPVEIIGLPFQLSNDATLTQFTAEDGLYVSSHWRVLPSLSERFLHKDLVTSCKDWFMKNEISEETDISGVFKKFTIAELGKHLRDHLPKDWQGCDRHVEWNPKMTGHPSESWLRCLWKFICSETSKGESQVSLEAIKNCPVFPTMSGKLVPPCKSKTVLFLHALGGVGFGLEVASALRKLGLPEIAWKQMCNTMEPPTDLKQVLEEYLALPTSHGDVTRVIQFLSETGAVFGNLTPAECNTLLHYFQEGCARKTLTPLNIQTIRKLSIFKLLEENRTTDIQSSKKYHTVEGYQVLMDEASIWMNHMNCVFLEPCPYLTLIYREFGISPITHVDMYLKYILPSFHLLSQKARLKHIENIRDKVLHQASKEDRESILLRLTHIPLILDQSNTPRPAGYFFDPDKQVFRTMVDPGQLLPEAMMPLRNFLQKIGLRCVVTPADFSGFAKEVESKANCITDMNQLERLCFKSRLLTVELNCNDSLHDQIFLQRISKIKFIPSAVIQPELKDIYPAYSSKSDIPNPFSGPFIAYHGSVPWQYLELVWSVSVVLPSWALPKNIKMENHATVHGCLGIESEKLAIMGKVLSHTTLVCKHMEKKNVIHKKDTLSSRVRKTVKDVMNKILSYLTDSIGKHEQDIKNCLQSTPICLVEDGRVFVRAHQLVFNMDEDHECSLRPYLYKVPRELGLFDPIFRLLGAEYSCSFDQLARLLSTLKQECGNQRLPPNEQKTTKTAVGDMFRLIHGHREKCKITCLELYLPSSEYILRKSSNLYYADPELMEQFNLASSDKEFIIPLKQFGFQDQEERRVISHLPERFRPKYPADKMKEKPCDTNEDCSDGEHCLYLAHIKGMVNSLEMTQVLLRLNQHQLNEKELCEDNIQCIKALQNFSKFVCQTELKLGLYDGQGQKIAERRHGLKAFFDKSTCTMYLEHTYWPMSGHTSTTFNKIAKCCNDILGGVLDSIHVSFLQSALDSPSAGNMNEVLSSDCGIPQYSQKLQAFQPDEHQPGKIIPRDIRHLLDQDPYNIFHKKEIVGYERSLHDRTASGKMPELTSFKEATEIVYARIVDQIDTDQKVMDLVKWYKIDIGQQEHITVSVTTLFKFLQPKEKDDAASSAGTLPEDPQRDREQIKKAVKEVFALPNKEEQKRVIHRLYRKWHPDKNPGQEDRSNEAFKFLKQEIKRHDSTDQYSQHYSYWESEVNRDREEAWRYQRMYNQSHRTQNRSSSNFVPPSFSKETPDPRSARLWFCQAKEHFSSAEQTSQLGSAPVQWIAFQIHQAAEVALKAAQYYLTGGPDNTNYHNLSVLARKVCQHRYVSSYVLIKVAGDLERLNCQFDKPRYPESWSSQTSGYVYQGFCVEDTLKLCKELLNLVQDIMGIKEF